MRRLKSTTVDDIVAYIADRDGGASLPKVQEHFGLCFSTARRLLRQARDLGLLRCWSASKNSVWVVPRDGWKPPPKKPKGSSYYRKPKPGPDEHEPMPVRIVIKKAGEAPPPRTTAVRSVFELGAML